MGYAFGWLPIALLGILFLDASGYGNFLAYFVMGSLIDVHRHYTFSFVYLDPAVRRTHPVRLVVLPVLCLALWTQTPALARSTEMVGAPEAAALGTWLWVMVQLLWQDRGGQFQWRSAVPLLAAGLLSPLALGAAGTGVGTGWIWLGSAVAVSVALHIMVSRDASRVSSGDSHWIFPAVALALLIAGAIAAQGAIQLPAHLATSLLLLTFVVWQMYHVLMQKYGILRVYSAKSGQPEKVPAWVDRMLVFGVVPAFAIWVGASQFESLIQSLAGGNQDVAAVLGPPLRLLGEHATLWMTLGVGFWATGIGAFAWHEWRVHGLRHAPRLWYAAGTTLLYLAVFQLGIAKAYLVFASSHGFEYIVFIWAYQKRRYSDPATRQAASPILRHPVLFYASFTMLVLAALFYGNYLDRFAMFETWPRVVFGETVGQWLLWFTLYHGILHFYWDGFLWKLRRPALQAQL